MHARRITLAVVTLCAVALLSACDDSAGDATTAENAPGGTRDPSQVAFSERGAKTTCPADVTGTPSPSTCLLAFERGGLRDCKDKGPGGYNVMASGVTCPEARQLRLPLGSHGPGGYDRRSAGVFRPWLAKGSFASSKPLKPVKPLGWTCSYLYEPRLANIRYVCWNGRAVVLFTFA